MLATSPSLDNREVLRRRSERNLELHLERKLVCVLQVVLSGIRVHRFGRVRHVGLDFGVVPGNIVIRADRVVLANIR